jgi:CDP-diacylglycerol---glycerol-3-phosphate 3-phosphatidyltransferase
MTKIRNITEGLLRRHRLLDAIRGVLPAEESTSTRTRQSSLKCFRLNQDHFGSLSGSVHQPPTPEEFHSNLCRMIRDAKHRVYLASLYVGPAASTQQLRESEFLDALAQISSSHEHNVQVKVLLDENRALRPVPTIVDGNASTTSSAKAVAKALHQDQQGGGEGENQSTKNQLYLLQVLPPSLRLVLPNPIDEVAGVFHIKVYIIDDSLILSGANLSEEYFVDRQDRYVWIRNGGGGLVDFYANLVEVLCRHASPFDNEKTPKTRRFGALKTNKEEFFRELTNLFVDDAAKTALEILPNDDKETMALCVPTFQAPNGKFWNASRHTSFLSDTEVTRNLVRAGFQEGGGHVQLKLSSAYLNPTHHLVNSLSNIQDIDLLTAGRLSHGFRPKEKAGNKGKDWIPTVFEHFGNDACQKLPHARLLHWERDGWTFHSKGLWLEQDEQLVAAIVGSGNFGERSHYRDMESNCVFLFPEHGDSTVINPWQEFFQAEWKATCESAHPVDASTLLSSSAPLPPHIKVLMPFMKSFF